MNRFHERESFSKIKSSRRGSPQEKKGRVNSPPLTQEIGGGKDDSDWPKRTKFRKGNREPNIQTT